MKLSIVIPVYKAEKWIGRCLDSIYRQCVDESNYEIVCVVDGSPDDSENIINDYKNNHRNIIVFVQENQGVSASRNKGIELSKGEYIVFVDSDDILLENSLPSLIDSMSLCSHDIVVCRSFINEREWPRWKGTFENDEECTPQDAIKRGFLHGCIWGCYYKRSLIVDNNILFPDGVSNGEDNFFFLSCLYFATSLVFKDIKLYRVIEEHESLSRTYTRNRVDGVIDSLEIMKNRLSEYPTIKEKSFIIQYIFYTCLSGLVACTLRTKGVGLLYLNQKHVKRYSHFNIDSNIIYMRNNMKMMKFSFSLFYLLSWVKHKLI